MRIGHSFPCGCLHRHANQCMACTPIHIGSTYCRGEHIDTDVAYTVWIDAKQNEHSLPTKIGLCIDL